MSTLCIILTAAQAEEVRGPTAPGAALEPALLADGVTYALPASILDDPAHVEWHAFLSALPRRGVAPEEWPQPLPGAGA